MSHLRLTSWNDAEAVNNDAPVSNAAPNPAAVTFAAFTPMNDQPALADRKATFVIGTGGLMLTTTLFFIMPLGGLVRPGVWPAVVLILALGMVCLTMLAMRMAYRCYATTAPPQPHNPLFFQNVASRSLENYSQALRGSTDRQALHDVLDYNHAMSRLGVAKYRLAGQALLCLRVAIPLWMLLLVVLSVRSTW
jgi:hypothetical protein